MVPTAAVLSALTVSATTVFIYAPEASLEPRVLPQLPSLEFAASGPATNPGLAPTVSESEQAACPVEHRRTMVHDPTKTLQDP